MWKCYAYLLTVMYCMSLCSCKKDILHWQKVQQIPTHLTCNFYHVRFIDGQVGFIGGGEEFLQAEVLKTTDGGFTWQANSYPAAGKAMYGLGVSPEGRIYMCGVDGTILHSADTGNTWQVGRIYDWLMYVGASFPSPQHGVFVSTVLQRQGTITVVDTGFNIVHKEIYQFGMNDIEMLSPSTGYVLGYGAVLKTTDSGFTWNFLDIKGDDFTGLASCDGNIWVCGANGSIFHTTDGGTTWERQRNGNDVTLAHYALRNILFTDARHGWAVGDNGCVIYTDDGGLHWAQYDKFTNWALRSIAQCSNGDLLVVGDNGSVYRITPGQF